MRTLWPTLWLATLGASAQAIDERIWLAPDLVALQSHQQILDDHLQQAKALGEALGRVHNQMALQGLLSCSTPEAPLMGWRARMLGQAQRDALQSARAQAQRLRRMRASPTVEPLLSPPQRQALDAQEQHLQQLTDAWQAGLAWQLRYVEPWYDDCPATPAASPGLPSGAPASAEERSAPIAILTVGRGIVCPSGQPAGQPVVIQGPSACIAPTSACACAPIGVLPGAILEGRP